MPKFCLVEGCGRTATTRGLCSPHYHRLIRYGDPTFIPKRGHTREGRPEKCQAPGCDGPATHQVIDRFYCEKHYQRAHKYGDPNKIIYAHNGSAKSHPEMAQILYGMRQRCSNKKEKNYKHYGGRGIRVCERWSGPYGLDNFIADMGVRPPGKTPGGRALYSIDRIDPNKDYCPENCRWATWWEQAGNQRRKNKTSKYTGVSYSKSRKSWVAAIDEGGKTHKKYAKTEEEALAIRKRMEEKYIKG